MDLSITTWFILLGIVCVMLLPFAVPGVLEALLSLGIASFLAAALLALGVLPDAWPAMLSALAISTLLLALLLWKPLRKLQHGKQKQQEKNDISDFVGTRLTLTEAASKTSSSTVQFSGVSWQLKLAPDCPVDFIAAGTEVQISSATVGVLLVTVPGQ
ncbi:NfeD family protein [Rheinheimera sp.]|uniref:NfeD family protein n=1 Tax=Rheinheimera sp. TaxID=1869214 RepID=UPI0027BA020B|nr:NfeD family protein [Rheinheimera sp.]